MEKRAALAVVSPLARGPHCAGVCACAHRRVLRGVEAGRGVLGMVLRILQLPGACWGPGGEARCGEEDRTPGCPGDPRSGQRSLRAGVSAADDGTDRHVPWMN